MTTAVKDLIRSHYSLGVRHVQLVLLFSCMAIIYVSRVNLSMAIVGMTGSENFDSDAPVFKWKEGIKGTILSSFFWGYLISNIPAAIVTHRFDNKILLSFVMGINTLFCVLTPVVAVNLGYVSLIVIRIAQGLSQGFLMPNIHSLLSKWVPPTERARSGAFVLGGMNFGIAMTMFTSGFLMSTTTGWPLIYYLSGALCFCWLIVWLFLGANSPDSHKSITEQEREYIKASIIGRTHENCKLQIPWKSIFTSVPVWAIMCAHMGNNWGMWTMLTEMPTFINSAMGYDIKQDGQLSALPYFLMWLTSIPLSFLADWLIKSQTMSLQRSRKFWNHIGETLTGILLILLPFVAEYRADKLTFFVYCLATIFNSCISFGFNINHIDISPNFSCILMGITNCAANITSIIAPLFAGYIIDDESRIEDWRGVFISSGILYIVGGVIFSFFGSGTVQLWNNPSKISKTVDIKCNTFPSIYPEKSSIYDIQDVNNLKQYNQRF